MQNQARAALAASGRSPRSALSPLKGAVKLIAHRGAGHEHNDPDGPPENTLEAVSYGFEQGADAVEIDVWRTADGVVVLHHDATTDRTTDRAHLELARSRYQDLQGLSTGSWKADQWRACLLPTLTDAAGLVPPGRGLVVEVVEGPQVVEDVLAATALPEDQTVYISKNLDTAGELKRQSGARVFWIVDTVPRWQIGGWAQGHRRGPDSRRHGFDEHADVQWLITQALDRNLDGLDTLFSYPPDLPPQVISAGLLWMVWTANDPRAIDQCIGDGAWAITTDNTAEVRSWMQAAGMANAAGGFSHRT
jgi:glycerophosphoryl diester phosphodiesterase